MKKVKKMIWIFLGILSSLIIFLFLLVQCTPSPVAYLTRFAFSHKEDTPLYGLHPEYEEMKSHVQVYKDRTYPSTSLQTYDIYMPKDISKTYPILLWLHGGAFVGGDKKDVHEYMISLASQGYVIYVLNYSLAPEQHYPTPLLETSALVEQLLQVDTDFPIDTKQFFIGGDSAGVHIAFQFITTQVNEEYREKMQLPQVLAPENIQGAISFSGLLDITKYDETNSGFSNFLYDQSAWAYFHQKNWKDSLIENGADFLPYINSTFPPTYITDGDKNSFLEQAILFKTILEQQHVAVDSLLWKVGNHLHEYQFHLDQAPALENFQKVVSFLQNYTN